MMFEEIATGLLITFIVIGIWSLIWKGIGLYRAARNKDKGWFVAILLLNTLGILPIVYLLLKRK